MSETSASDKDSRGQTPPRTKRTVFTSETDRILPKTRPLGSCLVKAPRGQTPTGRWRHGQCGLARFEVHDDAGEPERAQEALEHLARDVLGPRDEARAVLGGSTDLLLGEHVDLALAVRVVAEE
jgi:hypothetical protein